MKKDYKRNADILGVTPIIKHKLDYFRSIIIAERISQGEIIELKGLAEHIDSSDTLLLEWAGVPEGSNESN